MKICTSLGYRSVSGCVETAIGEEMVEVRADLCGFSVEDTVSVLKNISCEKILTVRGSDEGFLMEILGRIDAGSLDYLDLSLDVTRDFSDRVRDTVHSLGGKYVISFHDFNDTPCLDELYEIYDICTGRGADIVKIVTTPSCIGDVSRVLDLYQMPHLSKPLVAFAMGECGSFSRRLCLMLGAPFTYCYADGGTATASGQWSVSEMRRSFSPETYLIDLHHLPRCGESVIPCSKSFAQRAIICASLSPGRSVFRGYVGCDDTEAALRVARSLGAVVQVEGDVLTIQGVSPQNITVSRIDVGESGLLSRMMIPLAAVLIRDGSIVIVDGDGTLRCRNLQDAEDAVRAAGGKVFSNRGYVPFAIEGFIKGGNVEVDAAVSSQSVTGLLMSLPLLSVDSVLTVNSPVSLPYIRMTVKILEKFGVTVRCDDFTSDALRFSIDRRQSYHPASVELEPDWSSVAGLMVAAHMARYLRPQWRVSVPDIRTGTAQADERVLELLHLCGELEPFEFDATDCPDLFPIAATLACFCRGKSKLKGVGRLYGKESNRAESILSELTVLGGKISIRGNDMIINGTGELHGGYVRSHHDHRMAMALAIAALFIESPLRIDEVECISKSFPSFTACLEKYVGGEQNG